MIYTIEEIKHIANDVFKNKSFVDKVYLFGSYAKGEANQNSDIDFVVDYNENVGIKFYSLYPELQDAFGKNVDVLTNDEFLELKPLDLKRERIVIYERKN